MPFHELGPHRPEARARDDCWLAPGAHVIGRVIIGKGVGIWFGAVIRGDNELIEIGDGTNVQEGVLMHTDPGFPLRIGENVTVGHHAILHGCTIEANTLVGMGATILNGAHIGQNCLVGAGALVTENKRFPDDSLIVGSPAKVVRELDAASAERIRASASGYVDRARYYAMNLRTLGEAPPGG